MRAIERATRAELKTLPEPVQGCALARVAIDLAQRLDSDPADTAAVLLARELRVAMADLHRQSTEEVGGEIERFLAGISNPTFGDSAH